jgi:hypothetical protein
MHITVVNLQAMSSSSLAPSLRVPEFFFRWCPFQQSVIANISGWYIRCIICNIVASYLLVKTQKGVLNMSSLRIEYDKDQSLLVSPRYLHGFRVDDGVTGPLVDGLCRITNINSHVGSLLLQQVNCGTARLARVFFLRFSDVRYFARVA